MISLPAMQKMLKTHWISKWCMFETWGVWWFPCWLYLIPIDFWHMVLDNNNWYNNRIFQHFNVQPNPWVCSIVDTFNPPVFPIVLRVRKRCNPQLGWTGLNLLFLSAAFGCTTLSWIFWSPCFGRGIESLPLGVTYLLHPRNLFTLRSSLSFRNLRQFSFLQDAMNLRCCRTFLQQNGWRSNSRFLLDCGTWSHFFSRFQGEISW